MLIFLVSLVVIGGTLVLIVRQVVPPDLTTAIVNAISGQDGQLTIKATTVLDRIQGMSELTTTRFNYSSLVTSQRDMPDFLQALYGDKEILVAVGYVTGGIDLKVMTAADITQSGDTMTIQLPPAQLQACVLNEGASYVVTRDTGVFAKPAPNLDEAAKRYAIQQFHDQALQDDILKTAQANAKTLISNFVGTLPGIKNIVVNGADPDPSIVPDSCQ
jgi:hypothetical protein